MGFAPAWIAGGGDDEGLISADSLCNNRSSRNLAFLNSFTASLDINACCERIVTRSALDSPTLLQFGRRSAPAHPRTHLRIETDAEANTVGGRHGLSSKAFIGMEPGR
jgi:hypothetical protein